MPSKDGLFQFPGSFWGVSGAGTDVTSIKDELVKLRRRRALIGSPIGGVPIGAAPIAAIAAAQEKVTLAVSSLIIEEKKVVDGVLVKAQSAVWDEIVSKLGNNWDLIFQLPWQRVEELVAGALKKTGEYDEVVLTPRSGDQGRDVIATKHGLFAIRLLGSVKAYAPDREVPYSDVRELLGVLCGDRKASKGIIATTSCFPARIEEEPSIAPFLPTRLELIDGRRLQEWLASLRNSQTA